MKLIILVVALAALGGGGYYLYKHQGNVDKALNDATKDLNRVANEVGGSPAAKTPREAADYFSEAIKDRNYDTAAKYCTAKYAGELKRGSESAKKLGQAIDDLTYQMSQRSVMNDEMRTVLFFFDPFPKNVTITVGNVTDKEAVATFTPELPKLTGQQQTEYSTWNVDPTFWGALYSNLYENKPGPILKVPMVKEGDEWKLNFPANAEMQKSVSRLNDRAKYYAQQIKKLSTELKNDAETQSNFKKRLKEVFDEAAKSSN